MASLINLSASNLFYAMLGGFLPSLLWLWFWLKEDKRPEPRSVLMSVFIGGMAAVLIAMILEYVVLSYSGLSQPAMLLVWAFIEEIVKYLVVVKLAFSKKDFDEPIDAIIYMITVALGFASLENMFFIIKSFSESGLMSGLNIGGIRFIGATLLHTASSAIIGSFIAFSLRKRKIIKKRNALIGLFTAGILHFTFNYTIINNAGGNIFKIFIPLWIIIIAIIFIIEKVKKLYI